MHHVHSHIFLSRNTATLGATLSLEGWGWGMGREDCHPSLLIRSHSEQMAELNTVPTPYSMSVLSSSPAT